MFIFNRPMAAVAGALGIAFLMIGLERVCVSTPQPQVATRVPVDPAVVRVPAPVAQLVPLQGNRCQNISSPSRLQRRPPIGSAEQRVAFAADERQSIAIISGGIY